MNIISIFSDSALAMAQGFILCASLIIAVGPQNLFILRQGLRRQHRFTTAFFCTVPNLCLTGLGIWGIGTFISTNVPLVTTVTIGGILFLSGYGLCALRSAWRNQYTTGRETADSAPLPINGVVLTTLGVSLLNPIVYLDMLIIGTTSSQYPIQEGLLFGGGAAIAATIWFFMLVYGASWLTPLFRRPIAWRMLDIISGCFMLGIAYSIYVGYA